jgi:hypothetical protein
MRALFAGPWIGEFGFEIGTWQARVRAAARGYPRVVVGCSASSQALYEDFCHEFRLIPYAHNTTAHYRIRPDGEGWEVSDELVAPFVEEAESVGAVHLAPRTYPPGQEQWHRYGSPHPGLSYDVLLHCRWFKKGTVNADYRRCAPQDWWDRLVSELHYPRIASIGLVDASLHAAGTDDLRGVATGSLMDVMASSMVCVGPASGAIHLAAVCGCPQATWSDMRKGRHAHPLSKKRLLRQWNPFKVKVMIQQVEPKGEDHFWIPNLRTLVRNINMVHTWRRSQISFG